MTRNYEQLCPIARTLDMIGDRWTMLILRDLFLGAAKFTELLELSHGMPTKILSDRLKSLEHDQIIERRIYSEHPLRAEYHLTAHGRTLEPIMSAIYAWGMKHTITPGERPTVRKRIATRASGSRLRVKVAR
jgi:DNA-binding HxlR family transcriptional regulator